MITQKIDLNLIHGAVMPRVNVSQYDSGTRTLEIAVYNNTQRFVLLDSYAAFIQGTKADNRGFQYEGTIDDTNNIVTFDITEQMTACAGDVVVELVITNGLDDRIATGNFIIAVEKAALSDTTIVSETELPLIEQAAEIAQQLPAVIAQIEGYAEDAQTAAGNAQNYAGNAQTSATNAGISETNAAASETAAGSSATIAGTAATNAGNSATAAATSASNAEAYATGERGGVPVSSDDPAFENNAEYYAGEAANAADDATDAATSAETNAETAEAWATGTKNGTPVPSSAEQYENNAKYWSDLAAQYAQSFSGIVFKGSIAYASIPTSGMNNGDMYDINEAFVTDSRFEEGAGVACPAGTDIVWVASDSKWNILTPAGVYSFNGRAGAIIPAANDYDASQIKYGASSNVDTELSNKQATYTADATAWDTTPTQNSTKPVTSGGVYSALSGKQNTLMFDNVPTQNSANPVKSGGVYSALSGKQNTLTFDNVPTQNSANPVKSGGVYSAIENITPTVSTTDIGEGAPLASGKLYIVVS